MNTNHLKKFAQGARVKLLEQVKSKLEYVLTHDTAQLRGKEGVLQKLKEEIERSSEANVVDKVAYTWFNRFIALRFMDVNGFQPTGISILSPTENSNSPQILDEVHSGNIPSDLVIDKTEVLDILDGRIRTNNPDNEVFRLLLVSACNNLNSILPFLFERINDYTELLLPDDLTSSFSIVTDVVNGMPTDDCTDVEIIGWLYQFYISEKKDEVFASKKAVKKEDIPAATQLFTPKWIVEYMVQNTLGKLWLQNNPNSRLKEHMPYYIDSPSAHANEYLKVDSVEEIRFLDQACGSGHILVYAFELFTKIYEEEGYNAGAIPKLIIEKNLKGFEIDERAAQLSGLALMMQARGYYRRVFRKDIQPNILCYQDITLSEDNLKATMEEFNLPLIEEELWHSIEFKLGEESFLNVLGECGIVVDSKSLKKLSKGDLKKLDKEGKLPSFYLKDLKNLNVTLLNRLQKELNALGIITAVNELSPMTKSEKEIVDAHSFFASRLLKDCLLLKNATNFGSLIQPQSSAEEIIHYQERLSDQKSESDLFNQDAYSQLSFGLGQLLQLSKKSHCIVDNPPYMGGGNMNPDLSNFVKAIYPDSKADLMATFMEAGISALLPSGLLGMINQHSWMFLGSYENFRKKLIDYIQFDTLLHLGSRAFPEIGGEVVQNATFTFKNIKPDNKSTFIKLNTFESTYLKRDFAKKAIAENDSNLIFEKSQIEFYKIPAYRIGFWLSKNFVEYFLKSEPISEEASLRAGLQTGNNDRFVRHWWEICIENIRLSNSDANFVPYDKGGPKRKWFGNQEFVLNWKDEGEYLKKNSNPVFRNKGYYFKNALSYSLTNTTSIGFRIRNDEFIFDNQGSSLFCDENDMYYILGFMNSSIVNNLTKLLNPTMVIQVGDLSEIPFFIDDGIKSDISNKVKEAIAVAKEDWSMRENFWGFKQNELLRLNGDTLSDSFNYYEKYWGLKFNSLISVEEDINRGFISQFGLEDDLDFQIQPNEVTILRDESKLIKDQISFNSKEVFIQFISYSVGCIFGRYSLGQEGLILASQGESLMDYLGKVGKSQHEVSFLPDESNIVPVLDDEWFEDDIIFRFQEFLKASFGEKNFAKNLGFVEQAIGKDIRKFFNKDFYADHIKRYKKRPIYWMFSSPQGHFKVLVYLHRYTPDTLNVILNSYLREFVEKLNLHRKQQENIVISGSASEQNKARKEIDRVDVMLADCREYETEVLYPLASERIELDLDDGVLVNYNKMGRAVAEVKGLNDKKTKEKVRKFDWIDTTQIR